MDWRGITYKERCVDEGVSPVEVFEDNDVSQIRVFDVPWTSRQQAVYKLKGYPLRRVGIGGGAYVSRVTPHCSVEWVNSDNVPYLYCHKIECRGIGLPENKVITTTVGDDETAEEVPLYQLARLTAHYKAPLYDVMSDADMIDGVYDDAGEELISGPFIDGNGNPDEAWLVRYVTRIVHPQPQFFTIPAQGAQGTGMKYCLATPLGTLQGPSPVMQGLGKLIVPYNIEYTWHQVPESAIGSLAVNPALTQLGPVDLVMGCCNKDVFDCYPPGTLLLMGAHFKPGRSAFGDRIYDITYLIKYFQPAQGVNAALDTRTGHQFIFMPQNNGWVEVTTTGVTNFPTAPRTTGFASALSFLRTLLPGFGAIFPGRTPPVGGVSIYDWATFGNLFRAV